MSELGFSFGINVRGLDETQTGVTRVAEGLEQAKLRGEDFANTTADGLSRVRTELQALHAELSKTSASAIVGQRFGTTGTGIGMPGRSAMTIQAQRVILAGQAGRQPIGTFARTPLGGNARLPFPQTNRNPISDAIGENPINSLQSLYVRANDVTVTGQVNTQSPMQQLTQPTPTAQPPVVSGTASNSVEELASASQSAGERVKTFARTIADTQVGRSLANVYGDFRSDFANALQALRDQFGDTRLGRGLSSARDGISEAAGMASDWLRRQLSGLANGPSRLLGALSARLPMQVGNSVATAMSVAGQRDERRTSQLLTTLKGLAFAGGATVAGATMAGFSGTVEGQRMQTELQLLFRELASAFKPWFEVGIRAVSSIRRWLESLSAAEQKVLGFGILMAKVGAAVTGVLAPLALMRTALAAAAAVPAANAAAQAAGNLAGAAAAGGVQQAVQGGGGVAGQAAAGAGGAVAAQRVGLLGRLANAGRFVAQRSGLIGAAVGGVFGTVEGVRANNQEAEAAQNIRNIQAGLGVADKGRAAELNAAVKAIRGAGQEENFQKIAEANRVRFARELEGVDEQGRNLGGGAAARAALNRQKLVFGLAPELAKLREDVLQQQQIAAALRVKEPIGVKNERSNVLLAQGGFAAVGASFEEIQTNAILNDLGKSPEQEKQQREAEARALQEQQVKLLEEIKRILNEPRDQRG